MPKQTLFDDDSEEEVAIKTENEYAKKYDTWREKEEIYKLEQKYGSKPLNSDGSGSDSEDESDEPPEVSEEMEEQFLKTLSLLKTKDPRIYDPNFKFFEEKEKETVKEQEKPTLTFADSDDDDENDDGNIFTIEKKADIEPEDKPSTSGSKVANDGKIKEYLVGVKKHIESPIEKDLAPLKALWSDPNINEGEAFLRDYILNKKYLEGSGIGQSEGRLRDDDELEADEKTVEEQGKFERAYNFRFEEPDQEYLKRYPRTMNYIRPADERRAASRAARRARREADKRRKMDDIARLQALKLNEVRGKIARIKEVTGNDELAFKDEDIEGEFDPTEHDRRMAAIFDDQYYGQQDLEKPVFPDLDEELEIENWDKYDPETEKLKLRDNEDNGPHCEDADFNMDADYDPKESRATLLEQIQETLGKKRRNRKKKSKLAKLLEAEKPKFVPGGARSYEEFMDEYYGMECEDIIGGDLPTRFRYRQVVPNDYGLTVEEILLADDRELTQWVPLKRLVKHRPEAVQKSEIHTYRAKAADTALKRSVLPSLFKDLPQEPEVIVPQESKKKKKKKKNKRKEIEIDAKQDNENNMLDNRDENGEITVENDETRVENNKMETEIEVETEKVVKTKKSKKNKLKDVHSEQEIANLSNIEDNSLQNKSEVVTKNKKKNAKQKQEEMGSIVNNEQIILNEVQTSSKKKHKTVEFTGNYNATNVQENGIDKKKQKKMKNKEFNIEHVQKATPSQESTNIQQNKNKKRKLDINSSEIPIKKTKSNTQNINKKKEYQNNKNKFRNNKNKQENDKSSDNPLSKLSDERLKAYGLNPKKYRSFLKYKKF